MKSSHTARAAIGVVALLLTFAVAGCDEDDPSGTPPPSSTPSSPGSSSPTEATSTPTQTGPVEPTLPAEAGRDSKAGVEAFVTFYWDVVNYATKTGDVRLLRELDQPSCEGCEGGIQGIERIYHRGGRIVGGEYAVVRLEPVQSDTQHWAVVTHTRLGKQRTIGAGNLNGSFAGGHAKWLVALARVRGTWSVTTLEVL